MNKNTTARHLVTITAIFFCVFTSAALADGNGPPEFPVVVTNDAANPVVVSGDVTADVTGSVDVSSVPATLTDRLDLVLDELEDLNDAAQENSYPRAGYAEYMRFDREACGGPILCAPEPTRLFSQPIWASFIAVSTENDDGYIEFMREASDPVPALRFGHRNRQLPGVITATLPQAIKVSGVRTYCGNTVEDCEFAISVIGELDQ